VFTPSGANAMTTDLYREILGAKLPAPHLAPTGDVVSKYSPSEIRETISKLVAEDQLDLANALGEAGLALYPESEDILAIAGLLGMLREDWGYSVGIFNELLMVQGDHAPVTTHLMFIRSLRCLLEPAAALSAVMIAHEHYPNHPELEEEFRQISAQLGFSTAE
jgi:hypothetical protein